ncbi:MAG TPA: DUF1326 domain-containing protein [Chthonomonadaceae bacterium]|nr:DUF1326 domain-containing protein [Chthonomonadaceae bacterium]
MRNLMATCALALMVSGAALAAPTGNTSAANVLKGDYVEARTASVFAGACHYNGEVMSTGREAEMVWHIREGAWDDVSLAGLSAIAAITSNSNLQEEGAARRSVLFIDARATAPQMKAMVGALKSRYGKTLGEVVEVKRAPIAFERKDEAFQVEAKGVTLLQVDAMPDHACCKQPNMVCYKPLVEIKDRKVGYTRASGIQDKTLGTTWEKANQNTAFYGDFSF